MKIKMPIKKRKIGKKKRTNKQSMKTHSLPIKEEPKKAQLNAIPLRNDLKAMKRRSAANRNEGKRPIRDEDKLIKSNLVNVKETKQNLMPMFPLNNEIKSAQSKRKPRTVATGVGNKATKSSRSPDSGREQEEIDKGGVKRLFSPFNRFANIKKSHITNTHRRTDRLALLSTYPSSGLSAKEKSYILNSCQTRWTQYLALKSLATTAAEQHKIFTIYGTCKPVRKALTERGWVEKIPTNQMNLSKIQNGKVTTNNDIHGELERLLLSSLVSKYTPNFIWRTGDEIYDLAVIRLPKGSNTIENKLRIDALWTSKQGLCASMKRNYWFYIEDVSEVNGPRSYNTHDDGEVEDFIKDYKMTACSSLLKWVLSMVANERPIFQPAGKIALNVLVFALNRCKEYIFRKQNRDIDQNINTVSPGQWNTFLKKYYRIIGKEAVFKEDRDNKLALYLGYAKFLLKEMYRYRPQLSCEGCHNIWIIKPTNNSRGRGIRLASKLGVITGLLEKAKSKYVIQKYIEEPLLIHETKFDIRQYYLVTSTYPLVIWMYKDCYLKFSSQKYNLKNYHESIHLTNNAVQRKYTNCAERHSELPQNNMWHSDKYKHYLHSIGRSEVWDNIIYPGMRKSIIGIMLSCQDSLAVCRNRFELYGCDFILDKNYKPWLIEINSGPDLNHTTPVTAKICPAVLADIIKVVIDYRDNRRASTGKFECIYRQPMTLPRYATTGDMWVRGFSLPNHYFYKGSIHLKKSHHDDSDIIDQSDNSKAILKKIKQYYDNDSIMVKPEESESESVSSYTTQQDGESSHGESHTPESEYELGVAATIITMQLEELMDKLTSDLSDTTKSQLSHTPVAFTPTQSVVIKETNNEAKPKSETSSAEYIRLIPKSFHSKLFPFSRLDDGPTGKGSTVDVMTMKKLFDEYINNQRKPKPVEYMPRKNGNNILAATSEMFNFFNKKEKEYLWSVNANNTNQVHQTNLCTTIEENP